MNRSWLFLAALSLGACDNIPGLGGEEKTEEAPKVAAAESKADDAKKAADDAKAPAGDDAKAAADAKADGGGAGADGEADTEGAAEEENANAGETPTEAAADTEDAAGGSGGEAPAADSGGAAEEVTADDPPVPEDPGAADPPGDIGDPGTPAVAAREHKPPRGFWAAWAKKDAVFTVYNEVAEGEPERLEGKVAKVDVVDGVTVVHVEWSLVVGDSPPDEAMGQPFEVMLLWDDQARIIFHHENATADDVAAWVKEPLVYTGIPKKGDEWFTELPPPMRKPGLACLMDDQSEEGVECEDICYGQICFSETEGLVSLEGLLAPDQGMWSMTPPPPPEPEPEEVPDEPEAPGKKPKKAKKPSTKKPTTKKPTKKPVGRLKRPRPR